jgi:hypothetical protein
MQEFSPQHRSDVPPLPVNFNEYVEHELHERTRAAYERGVDRGARYRLGAMLIGMVVGSLVGFGLGVVC